MTINITEMHAIEEMNTCNEKMAKILNYG